MQIIEIKMVAQRFLQGWEVPVVATMSQVQPGTTQSLIQHLREVNPVPVKFGKKKRASWKLPNVAAETILLKPVLVS